jgi:hypothetical protein
MMTKERPCPTGQHFLSRRAVLLAFVIHRLTDVCASGNGAGVRSVMVRRVGTKESMAMAMTNLVATAARRCSGVLAALMLFALVAGTVAMPARVAAAGTVGDGTPGSCTEAALVAALANGGAVSFNCGADPGAAVR